MPNPNITITKDMVIGEVLNKVPGASQLIQKYFQGECFGCPSVNLESLEMAAKMHDLDINELVAQIQEIADR